MHFHILHFSICQLLENIVHFFNHPCHWLSSDEVTILKTYIKRKSEKEFAAQPEKLDDAFINQSDTEFDICYHLRTKKENMDLCNQIIHKNWALIQTWEKNMNIKLPKSRAFLERRTKSLENEKEALEKYEQKDVTNACVRMIK